ncbi:MAG: hypothetical protein DME50_08425 [Verrucomicrobia bacterium]|nr:MAG: hypothetical protein DME85_13150 [Verrucomicrobiota bacterium]PYK65469.1 MAG: hypothetical protein DME50_08425 [Verrucomicrobiota bacterium]
MKKIFQYKNDYGLAIVQQMCRKFVIASIIILASAIAFGDTNPIGLVLSGGGAKGSFEVGALQYLYENGFCAGVICSTSVGSVNAIQLAHGGTKTSQKAAFDKLKTIWQTELTFNQDMYVEAPWLAGVSPRTRTAIASLFDPQTIDFPQLARDVVFFPPYAIGQAVVLGGDLQEGIEGLKNAQSIFTLDPIRSKLKSNLNGGVVASSGVELRLVAVSLDSGAIRYITQDGHVLETDGRPVAGADPTVCPAERAAYEAAIQARMDLLERSHTERTNLSEELKRAAAEVLKARTRLGQCTTRAGSKRLVVNVADGVIASASIPCVFPPVVLGNESYVDGGVRWVLPLKAALDFPKTEAIVAINASPAGVPSAKLAYRNTNLLDIAERSVLDILLWEIQERHLEVAKLEALQHRKKVWVVTPRADVHDTLTIDPGLIDINIGYGYMCAADVVTNFPFAPLPLSNIHGDFEARNGRIIRRPPTPAEGMFVNEAANPTLAALADAIAKCRRRCWELEYNVFGALPGDAPFDPRYELKRVPSPQDLDEVRLFKSLLFVLVAARQELHGKLPPGAASWADSWERHRWAPSDVPGVGNTPWSAFVSPAGNRVAATRPTAMLVKAPDKDPVYLLTPFRCWITSPEALARVNVGGAAVNEIPAEYLDALPKGSDIL